MRGRSSKDKEVKMRFKIHIVSMVVLVAFALSTIAYAQGMGGGQGGGGGGMMGGQGGGMTGGQGGGMMGSGEWMSKLWELLSNRTGKSDPGDDRERAALRTEIREKRRDLVSLVQAENPDRVLINQKIEELSRLESELDSMMASSEDIE
jgi:Spy/CpxP family protein refolding chaperone